MKTSAPFPDVPEHGYWNLSAHQIGFAQIMIDQSFQKTMKADGYPAPPDIFIFSILVLVPKGNKFTKWNEHLPRGGANRKGLENFLRFLIFSAKYRKDQSAQGRLAFGKICLPCFKKLNNNINYNTWYKRKAITKRKYNPVAPALRQRFLRYRIPLLKMEAA